MHCTNAGVTESYDFQVFHAVFLLFPPKKDTVSHPVSEWKKGKAIHFWGPRVSASSCIGKNLKCFPVPNAIQSSDIPNRWADEMASTTSVSTVRINALLYYCFTASSRWSSIRVLASSCVHGAKPETSRWLLQRTSIRHVAMIALPLSILVTCDDRNENNSVLFSLIHRNARQFWGTMLDASTRLLIPFPLLLRVSSFKLSGL